MSSPLPMLQPVSPSDCALAVGVPLTREEFLSDLARPDLKDYAPHFKRTNFLSGVSDEYYVDLFETSARVARRVCDEVEELGVTVRRTAGLSDLTALLQQFKVVTLVTHWRFLRVLPEDIVDAGELWQRLSAPRGRVQAAVAHAVSELDPTLLRPEFAFSASLPDSSARLAAVLTEVVVASHSLYKTFDTDPIAKPAIPANGVLERLTRVELEQAFAGLIADGKSVELANRMFGVGEIVAAVPQSFQGLIDLTTCNSVILGKAIKSRHPGCSVAMNRYETPLHVRMPLYKLVIADLAKRAAPYADTLTRFHK